MKNGQHFGDQRLGDFSLMSLIDLHSTLAGLLESVWELEKQALSG
jgi:hypothetical protein